VGWRGGERGFRECEGEKGRVVSGNEGVYMQSGGSEAAEESLFSLRGLGG